jgi:hypothetical protein
MNDHTSLPIAFSWCPGEDHESYYFFWQSLKAHLPTDCLPPGVVISDQATAIPLKEKNGVGNKLLSGSLILAGKYSKKF